MQRDRAAIYAKGREHELAKARAYYAANRDRLRAKSRARAVGKREEMRAYHKGWVLRDRQRRRALHLWRAAKVRATQRGLEFTISVEDLVIPPVCPVLGIPIVVEASNKVALPGAPSVDRIDNSRGYTPDNVRVISFRANTIKRDSTLEEMRLLLANWDAR
jgi:hypothetical protein